MALAPCRGCRRLRESIRSNYSSDFL
jgi:hypothetical protein